MAHAFRPTEQPDAGSGIPALPGRHVARPRLLHRLAFRDDVRLAFVRGGAGFGKTALLAASARALAANGVPAVWHGTERTAADRPSFWASVAGRLRATGVWPADAAADTDADTVVARILGTPGPLLLAVDDADALPSAVAVDLARLLDRHTGFRVIVASREATVLEEPSIAARHMPHRIGAAELAFTPEETRAVAAPSGLGVEQATAIHQATAGWPLGVRLAVLESGAQRHPSAVPDIVRRLAPHARRLMADLPADVLAAALRLSVAATADVSLASLLTGEEEIAEPLARLEAGGLGVWETTDDGLWFRLQPAARDALLQELHRRSPALLETTRRRYAVWLQEHDRPVDALREYARLADYGMMADLAGRRITQLSLSSPAATDEVLAGVPATALSRFPALSALRGLLLIAGRSSTAQVRAFTALSADGTDPSSAPGPSDSYWILFAQQVAARLGGRHDAAATTADRLLGMLDGALAPRADELGEGLAAGCASAAAAFLLVGRHEDALAALSRIDPSSGIRHRHLAGDPALVQALRGDLVESARACERARAAADGEPARGVRREVGRQIAEAILLTNAADADAALAVLDEIRAADDPGELWPFLLWARGVATLIARPPAAAVESFAADLARYRRRATSTYACGLLGALHADLLLAAGHARQAHSALADLPDTDSVAVARARAALGRADLSTARHEAEAVAWSAGATPVDRLQALTVLALAASRSEESEAAIEAVSRAAAVAEANGLAWPWALAPRRELCALLDASAAHRPGALARMPERFAPVTVPARLTAREASVLHALQYTASLDEIARAQHVSLNTVRSQLRSVYRKLGARSRAQALSTAARNGMLSGGPADQAATSATPGTAPG